MYKLLKLFKDVSPVHLHIGLEDGSLYIHFEWRGINGRRTTKKAKKQAKKEAKEKKEKEAKEEKDKDEFFAAR